LDAHSDLLTFLHVLPVLAHVVAGWMDLVRRYPVTGADVFDLQIVATMLLNDVQRIYTFNARDFEMIRAISVITP
jgi:predicted nucleic acid-binding protein